jgi:hypothetical protein
MWWRKPKPEPSRVAQLTEARDKLRRQIEIMRAGPVYMRDGTPQTAQLIAELKATLADIEQELRNEPPGPT